MIHLKVQLLFHKNNFFSSVNKTLKKVCTPEKKLSFPAFTDVYRQYLLTIFTKKINPFKIQMILSE